MKTIKQDVKTQDMNYQIFDDIVFIETKRNHGILTVDDFNKCENKYNKILKALSNSNLYCPTNQLLEYYSKYQLLGIDDSYYHIDIHYGNYSENKFKLYVETIKEFEQIYKSKREPLVIKQNKDCVCFVDYKTSNELKSFVIVEGYYENYFSDFNTFALNTDGIVPLYEDPENDEGYYGLILEEYLSVNEKKEAILSTLLYYPTDDEWNKFLDLDEDREEYFCKIINEKYEKWLKNNDYKVIEKQAQNNINTIIEKIKSSLSDYKIQIENNIITVDIKPRKIIISLSESIK